MSLLSAVDRTRTFKLFTAASEIQIACYEKIFMKYMVRTGTDSLGRPCSRGE